MKAELKNYRQSPRKVRLVADTIRGKKSEAALNILTLTPKKASLAMRKLLVSAIANADHNSNVKAEDLFIKEITVNDGPILKRSRARARGRAFPIHKHTCHINIVLDNLNNKIKK